MMFLGDTHGNRGFCKRAIDVASDLRISRIVQVGDFGYWPRTNNGNRFLHDVGKHAKERGVEWYWLAGNHEDYTALQGLCTKSSDKFITHGKYPLHHIRNGASWIWDGVRFGCFSGAYSIDRKFRVEGSGEYGWFAGEMPDESLIDGLGSVDVLLTHDSPIIPPSMYGARFKDDSTSRESQASVYRALVATDARLLVHGHWHLREQYGVHRARVQALDMDQAGLAAAAAVFDPATRKLFTLDEWGYR